MKVRATFMSAFATIATLSACAFSAHAGTTLVPWHVTAGQPAIHVGKEVAFFVWHSGNEVYVEDTNTNPKGDNFTGTITVQDGIISLPQGISLEKNDSITQVNPQTLTFSFHTYTGLDGLKFNLDRAVSHINMSLKVDGKTAPHIYAGSAGTDLVTDEWSDGYLHFIIRADDDAPYDWSLTAGEPNIPVGKESAYFVWHDSAYVYVVCTGDFKDMQYFDGEVRLHTGPITDVTAMADNSTYKFLAPNVMRWFFETADGEAGVRFAISPAATKMGFTLHLDGLYLPKVYFGANMLPLQRNADDSIVFDLTK
jgi:hypothetical protein